MRPPTDDAELTVRIESFDRTRYRLQILSAPAGGHRFRQVESDFAEVLSLLDPTRLEDTILFGDSMSRAEGIAPLPQRIGEGLFRCLFTGGLDGCLGVSRALLRASNPSPELRLRLVLDPTRSGQLASVPWELLYQGETREYLGRQISTPIVRHLEVARPTLAPLPIQELRILLVLANPSGVDPLETQLEATAIRQAWTHRPGVVVETLISPTLEALRKKVRSWPFHGLHFVGHGEIGIDGEGLLLFESAGGEPHPVSGTVLAETIKDAPELRLVFLNACGTAHLPRSSRGHDPYSGAASALVIAGVPGVVAMQFAITDRAALVFSRGVYEALATGDSLENAVTEGRLAVFRQSPDTWEWATPVLFLGTRHGKIFESSSPGSFGRTGQPQAPGDPEGPPKDRLSALRRKLDLQFFDEVLDELESLEPDDPDAARMFYYRALARVRGRRPRRLRLGEVRDVEQALSRASRVGEEDTAEMFFLRALIVNDFHRYNGFDRGPTSLGELLTRARRAPCEVRELERLLHLVPGPDDEVRRAILSRLDLTQP